MNHGSDTDTTVRCADCGHDAGDHDSLLITRPELVAQSGDTACMVEGCGCQDYVQVKAQATTSKLPKVKHKLVRHGKGENAWGECACGQWAWLGTYEMPKGRLPKLRAAFAEHVEYEETQR